MITDPGCSWISVPHSDIKTLDLVNRIGSKSYVGLERVYLDMRRDSSTFIDAARAARWEVLTRDVHTDTPSWVRDMAPYEPHYLTNPLSVGGRCIYLPSGKEMEVVGMSNHRVYVGKGREAFHRINRNNPYVVVRPL